jgi:hypothetical protein
LNLGETANLDLGHASRRLDPAEHLFDPFAAALADVVADMAQGPFIDGGLSPFAGLGQMTVDGDVWGNLALPQGLHEVFDIEGLVAAERDPSAARAVGIDQIKSGLALGRAGRLRDLAGQAIPLRFSIRTWPM